MKQPIKKKKNETISIQESMVIKSKKKKKKIVDRGKQPVKKSTEFWVCKKPYKVSEQKDKRKIPGTSNLEVLFEEMFLKKIGLDYVYQYEYCGYFYDFAILNPINKNMIQGLIEINGSYWHADPRFYDRNNLIYENQKRQIKTDKIKEEIAFNNCISFLCFWEYDIHNDSQSVLNTLKKRFGSKLKK